MSSREPNGPYVYQPFGSVQNMNLDRPEGIYAIGGLPPGVTIKGLTKDEAVRLLKSWRENASRDV